MQLKAKFKETFESFMSHRKSLKTISVASATEVGKPNSAVKMLIDIVSPNLLYLLDYKFTQTYANVVKNPHLSVSFMDDDSFTGYRLTGVASVMHDGREFDEVKKAWEKKLIAYEADRIIKRIQGGYSAHEAENSLPKDFVIVKFVAQEASVIKPDRVFRAIHGEDI